MIQPMTPDLKQQNVGGFNNNNTSESFSLFSKCNEKTSASRKVMLQFSPGVLVVH